MLFDLKNDPQEFVDLGGNVAHRDTIEALYDKLFAWAIRPAARTTLSKSQLVAMRTKVRRKGVMIGVVGETDVPSELTVKYRGRKTEDRRETHKKAAE